MPLSAPSVPQPKAIHGFERINRFWDRTHDRWSAKILPGEFYVSKSGEIISTVLGSCISVCIRDTVMGIGGMNHFMLPEEGDFSSPSWVSDADSKMARYGNWAIEFLINELVKNGADRKRFEVKIFGGGQVVADMSDVGQRNILFAFSYFQSEGFTIAATDVGDAFPRKVLYFSDTGKVLLKKLKSQHNTTILDREQSYHDRINERSDSSGDIELFG